MMRTFVFLISLFLSSHLIAQDSSYVRSLIDSLCAPRYHGRGYVENGDVKAAEFIVRECRKINLLPLGESYFQDFTLAVNTFPGAMDIRVDGKALLAGEDFIPNPGSPAIKGSFEIYDLHPRRASKKNAMQKLAVEGRLKDKVVLLDGSTATEANQMLVQTAAQNPLNAKAYIVVSDKKLTWSVARRLNDAPVFELNKASVPKRIKEITIDVDQEWLPEYQSKNVAAIIRGKKDSMVVFTAHYDHLGRMGKDQYIAGASDNASGTAMLFDLARHYLRYQPEYTTVFIWFAAEEAGLVGSKYFVDNSPIDLQKIKFLLNLDLMADAKTGITAVNGKVYPGAFENLLKINEREAYLGSIKSRGAAANSDHYPFYEKGVPCFFIYTMGDYKHYHDVHDIPANIPLTNYSSVFRLLTDFVEEGL